MSDGPVPPTLTVVVPVWHDTDALAGLLAQARAAGEQWIVVNGDAADRSLDELRRAHGDVTWLDTAPGRGRQLAAGVAEARGDVVLLLHADTRLGRGWRAEVTAAAPGASYHWGCFRLRLDAPAWQARAIEAMVRARVRLFRLPYGDQAIFVRRTTLEQVGGVPPLPLMEDVALARALARLGPPWRSRVPALTSARRWERDGWARRTLRNWWTMGRYLCGVPPERLVGTYAGRAPHEGAGEDGTDRC
ncbi:glycosyl transferase family 2 [Luteitalea sp. TBR-22]|uniref:TIGR04283 family arsenosugar biosynthesis glycosyltransferase n=1 Tax=Luteitalea sp. TBR-22 TaxID=2802971 RepID=UPI001AF3D8AF|nr:TIGR04283 family arsenosugar biosynthesis glycosyltransferase [Luteitalea sp. TBR-22]BCS33002.1 glycosyl transferase family 2 [Luteitalea sp. TBR-22]